MTKIVIISILILCLLFFVISNSKSSKINSLLGDEITKMFEKNTLNSLCPDTIVPEEILMIKNYDGNSIYLHYQNYNEDYPASLPVWKDGTEIGFNYIEDKQCTRGESNKQNINYFYCKPLKYSKFTKEISVEGEITNEISTSYDISLILEEKEVIVDNIMASLVKYKIISSSCKEI